MTDLVGVNIQWVVLLVTDHMTAPAGQEETTPLRLKVTVP
jgi:hypothetical protein